MAADRLSVALVLLSLGAAATASTVASVSAAAGSSAAEYSQPFTVQDLVRLERVSELAA